MNLAAVPTARTRDGRGVTRCRARKSRQFCIQVRTREIEAAVERLLILAE